MQDYYPSFKEFLKLSRRANVVSVYKEISADLDTPVSAFLKINRGDYGFLLESVEKQERIARYSFLGINPSLVFQSKAKNIRITYPQQNKTRSFTATGSPLDEIKKIMQAFKPARIRGLPRFCGGLVGYMGYDMVRFFEEIPDKNPDDLKLPDSIFLLTDTMLAFDHVNHTIKIISNIILPDDYRVSSGRQKGLLYREAVRKINSLYRKLKKPLSAKERVLSLKKQKPNLASNFKKREFEEIVKKAKGYIRRGDIIQVVLSQRLKLKIDRGPFDIYRNLRSLNPSPYMFFLKLKDLVLVGSSPEMLVRCEDGIVQTRPIAGTRPRGATEEEDRRLELELLRDRKEKAEHIMLVDLGRNDLGRVCKPGKVEVKDFMSVERYSHVMHLVSEVRGVLGSGFNVYDALRACFPAGTLSGSPKIRAMEIIDELENLRRGLYGGCVGYFSFFQNMDTCITIRTIVIKDKTAYIQAGAGIVADSLPENEYLESMSKAGALLEAIVN